MSTESERLKELRKSLNMKQGDFAEKIATTQGHISDIENGRKNLSDRTIKLICLEEWNGNIINEDWLKTGKGDMFLKPQKNDLVAKAAILLGQHDPTFEAFVETYSKLDPSNRTVLVDFGIDFVNNLKKFANKD